MPTTYREADSDVYSVLVDVLEEHFPALDALEPELSITILMATNYRGPAVKFAGVAATAKIKIVGPEERSNGGSDLRILIDDFKWAGLSGRQKQALLHHELTHVELKRIRGSGQPKLDPYGRPVVKLKPDDWLLTGFEQTVEAFGADALEHRAVLRVHEKLQQLVLPFVEASPVEVAGVREPVVFADGKVTPPGPRKRRATATPAPAVKGGRRKSAMLPEGLQ